MYVKISVKFPECHDETREVTGSCPAILLLCLDAELTTLALF